MRTDKYKIGNCGLLNEADRSMYMSEDTNEYDKPSHSNIDYERTPFNYNLSENNIKKSDVLILNEGWRGRKLKKDDNAFFGTVLTLPKDFLPELEGLEGKEITEYIMLHEDIKEKVNKFFKEGYESLKRIYGLTELDVCSAWVHFDEHMPHLHFYAIPHVHDREEKELTDKDKEKIRDYHLSEENPKQFYEEQKKIYTERVEVLQDKISKAKSNHEKDTLEKRLMKRQKDLDSLLSKTPEDFAHYRHSQLKSKNKKLLEHDRETVSYEQVVPLEVYNTQHNIVQADISAALGFDVHVLNGTTEGRSKEYQKLSKEEKIELMTAHKELQTIKGLTDEEAARYACLLRK